MAQKPEIVLKELKAKKFAPVYFLDGEEAFYIDQISDYIEKNAIAPAERSFNQVVLYGKDSNMGLILNNARKFPMMAERQVVIVKEMQSLPDFGKEEAQDLLKGYVENPLPSTILVMSYKFKKVNLNTKLGKSLNKHAVFVRSEKVPEYKMINWVQDYFQKSEHSIEPMAAQLLSESIGNNLEVMTNEIGKMVINFKEPTKITASHISQYIGINKDYNNFEFLKAMGFRDNLKANKIVNYFIQNPKGHPVIPLFSLMYNYFIKIALIHQAGAKTEYDVAGVIGLPPFVSREYLSAARNYNLGKVIDVFKYIKEADLRYKGIDSGSMSNGEILRELVYKILH